MSKYESHGRRLMIEFKCWRCKKTAMRPYEECLKDRTESFTDDLYTFSPPKDWRDGGFYYPMFCGECAAAYDQFMKGEVTNNE